ncbi:NAD(P)-dependent alcohol dehydrogenase [Pseudonocardia acidicola]|uniref:NAD(P)-dependent alcohol dehydrogenase n=1 Tax=Pseudonocardia acidicola TaxID=2724939 RepID=UPI0030840916
MRAAVVDERSAPFTVEDVQLERPRPNEVRVRMVATGICHTDLAVRDRFLPTPMPIVLGHEGAGVIEEVGSDVRSVRPGDHVVLGYAFCGECPSCTAGKPAYCVHRGVLRYGGTRPDGSHTLRRAGGELYGSFFGQSSFAEYALADERFVVPVPGDAPLEYLGPLGCSVQTGVGSVLAALRPDPGASLAVFGTGPVGMSAVLGAGLAGCDPIIAVDLRPGRLQLARELGATHTVNPTEDDPVIAIRDLTGGGAAFSVETTAVPTVLRAAVDSLGIRGRCGTVGVAPAGAEASFEMNTLLFGRSVQGILLGDRVPREFVPELVDLHLAGKLPFDRFCRFYELDRINEAVAATEGDGEVLKPLVTFGRT